MPEITISPMTLADVDAVHAIEAATFPVPWSRESFEKEVTENKCARYLVLREDGVPVAYAGMWLVIDEAHVTNPGVPQIQRKGAGAVSRAGVYGCRLPQALLREQGRRADHVSSAAAGGAS